MIARTLIFFILFVMIACVPKDKKPAILHVQVVNAVEQPIGAAIISIDGKVYGSTNDSGYFEQDVGVQSLVGKILRVEAPGFRTVEQLLDNSLAPKVMLLKRIASVIPEETPTQKAELVPSVEPTSVQLSQDTEQKEVVLPAYLPFIEPESRIVAVMQATKIFTVYVKQQNQSIAGALCTIEIPDGEVIRVQATSRGRCVFHYRERYEGATVTFRVEHEQRTLVVHTLQLKDRGLSTVYPQPLDQLPVKGELVGPPVAMNSRQAPPLPLIHQPSLPHPFTLQGQVVSAESAADYLAGISRDDDRFFAARHLLGEIFGAYLNKPAQAAKIFGEIERDLRAAAATESVLARVRFNEGVAILATGEKLLSIDSEAARIHVINAKLLFSDLLAVEENEFPGGHQQIEVQLNKCKSLLAEVSPESKMLRSEVQKWRKKTIRQ